MRSLGPAVALSILAHGGAVATVGTLGALWLAGAPSPAAPALYVDLVEPILATNDRIAPGAPPAPRPRRLEPVERRAAGTAPEPREPSAAAPPEGAAVPAAKESAPPPTSGPTIVTPPEVTRPPVAPVPPVVPEPRAAPRDPAPVAERGIPGAPEPRLPSPSPDPPPAAAPVVAPSEAVAPSAVPTVPRASARPGLDEEPGASIAAASTRGTGAAPASPPGATSTAETRGSGASHPEAGATGELARLTPGDARSSGAGDGVIPPQYEAYVLALRQRVQDRLVYPWTAARRGQQGTVELEVRVGAEGHLVGVEVVAGARAETLRAAAVTAVRGAAPFPFPPGVKGRPLVIRLPVEFQLR